MNSEMRAFHVLRDIRDDALDLVRQRPAVGVTEHDPARTGIEGCLGNGERIIAVALVAIEEMLTIDHRLALRFNDGADRLIDRLKVFFIRNAERNAYVVVPRLRDEADAVSRGLQDGLQAGIVRHRPAGALGHAEGRETGRFEIGARRKKLGIRGVGAGISAFDVVDAKLVEYAHQPPLVLKRKVDASRLHTVAQRRVEEVEALFVHECFAGGAEISLLGVSRFFMVVLESHCSAIGTELRLVCS